MGQKRTDPCDKLKIESQRQLGERYWQELNELVEQAEISQSLARRIMDDMFIPAEAGQTPRLRWRFWRNYVAHATRDYS